jgi:phospholipid-translocating ATPase
MANKTGAENGGDRAANKVAKRSRWATRKLTVKRSSLKRMSIINRKNKRGSHSEKKRVSGGTESLRQAAGDASQEQEDANSVSSEDVSEPRQLYFNIPLPGDLKDSDGHPRQRYPRNKIRTAKFTALSFLPKDLWFQFHNIANIFFLFTVILVVSVLRQLLSLPDRRRSNHVLRRYSPSSTASTLASMPCL